MSINRNHRLFAAVILLGLFGIAQAVLAEGDEGILYGKVTLYNGKTYQGPIRWGDEESFWNDMFNSTKVENTLDLFRSEIKDWRDLEDDIYDKQDRTSRRRRINIWNREYWDERSPLASHVFKCFFGDIQNMELRRSDEVILTFKDGAKLEVEGGSSDIGAEICVMDEELGEVKLKWSRVDLVEFMPTPRNLKRKFGEPLYGSVETRNGDFEGFIQWDEDETLTTDVLDGDDEDGSMEIEFGQIASIEKYSRGSLVTLKSGREFHLTGSNDVNSENRGVVIKDAEIGRILVGWRDFEKVTFKDPAGSGPGYADFPVPKLIEAEVLTKDGESHSGNIFFDVDEAYDWEILDGQDGDTEFMIPFRNIRSILPERRFGTTVVLKNGKELHLEGTQDVDEENDGVVVWEQKGKSVYLPWFDIKEVKIK